MRKSILVPAALALLVSGASAEAALTLQLTINGYQVGSAKGSGAIDSTTNAALSETFQWKIPASTTAFNDRAGQFSVTDASNTSFTAFCIELTQGFPNNNTIPTTPITYNVLTASAYSPLTTTAADKIGRLYSEGLNLDSTDKVVAFQIALWEIRYETLTTSPYSVATGNATFGTYSGSNITANALSLANTYIANTATTTNRATLTVYQSDSYQDLITATVTAVPEPATVGLMVFGIAGIGIAGLRRRRTET